MEMLQKVLVAFGVIGVSLSLILVLFSFITWEIASVLNSAIFCSFRITLHI